MLLMPPPFDSIESIDIKAYLLAGKNAKITGWHDIEIPLVRQPGGPLAPFEVSSYHYKAQIDHFVDCIKNKKPLGVTGADGQIVVGISDAAYESAKSGRKVNL